jgi:hypothetical protein
VRVSEAGDGRPDRHQCRVRHRDGAVCLVRRGQAGTRRLRSPSTSSARLWRSGWEALPNLSDKPGIGRDFQRLTVPPAFTGTPRPKRVGTMFRRPCLGSDTLLTELLPLGSRESYIGSRESYSRSRERGGSRLEEAPWWSRHSAQEVDPHPRPIWARSERVGDRARRPRSAPIDALRRQRRQADNDLRQAWSCLAAHEAIWPFEATGLYKSCSTP